MKKEKIFMDLINILESLKSKKNFKSASGVTDQEIVNLEEDLAVCFPNSYKIFLKNMVMLLGLEII